jgi:hypothetical protein
MGKVAFIDENSKLHSYPSDNVKYNNTYTKISGANSAYNDIPGAAYGSATVDQCETSCDNNTSCAGFAFSKSNNVCWPKTSSMYPTGDIQLDTETDLYVRQKEPLSPPIGVSSTTNNTNSIIYQNYINGGDLGKSYGLANATSVQKQQLAQLQSKMNQITSQINDLTSRFGSGTIASEDQSKKNVSGLGDYLTSLTNTNKKISNFSENVDNILDDSDIVVLQKNYDYLFWTILASGTVLVSINLVKQ